MNIPFVIYCSFIASMFFAAIVAIFRNEKRWKKREIAQKGADFRLENFTNEAHLYKSEEGLELLRNEIMNYYNPIRFGLRADQRTRAHKLDAFIRGKIEGLTINK